jgi:hypothetical protein
LKPTKRRERRSTNGDQATTSILIFFTAFGLGSVTSGVAKWKARCPLAWLLYGAMGTQKLANSCCFTVSRLNHGSRASRLKTRWTTSNCSGCSVENMSLPLLNNTNYPAEISIQHAVSCAKPSIRDNEKVIPDDEGVDLPGVGQFICE